MWTYRVLTQNLALSKNDLSYWYRYKPPTDMSRVGVDESLKSHDACLTNTEETYEEKVRRCAVARNSQKMQVVGGGFDSKFRINGHTQFDERESFASARIVVARNSHMPPSNHNHPNQNRKLIGQQQPQQQFRAASTGSSRGLEEFLSYVTCSSVTCTGTSSDSARSKNRRDVTLLDSHLFNCGTTTGIGKSDRQHPPITKTKQKTTVSSTGMQRASVARRSDINPMSPGLRSRSSERHISLESDQFLSDHNNNSNSNPTATTLDSSNMETPSGNTGTLYRSMSDPFDTAHGDDLVGGIADNDDDDDDDDHDAFILAASTSQMNIQHNGTDVNKSSGTSSSSSNSNSIVQIPTFARYPCLEHKNKNCWSEPPITIFSVRGMNYCTDQKKVPSPPYLLRARGSDIFLTDPKKPFQLDAITNSILGGQLLKLPTLAIIFRFPWGYMNLYFEIPTRFSKYINDGTADNGSTSMDSSYSIAEQVFAKWLQGDATYKNERLKLIPYVAEGPWVVRNMVTGRPAIIGKKLPVTYQLTPATSDGKSSPLLMATLDIGNSSATAKRIVSVCRRYMSALTVDIGFVIQGDCPAELPEQMLGAMRIHGPDPLKAPKLN